MTLVLIGEASLRLDPPDMAEASKYFQLGLDPARERDGKQVELRAATSLSRLWQSQSKRQEAHALLRLVYDRFTEGFDTKDLKAAKALLEELK